MRSSAIDNKNLSKEQKHDMMFPRWYDLEFDHTSNKSGCFQERPGQILMNIHIEDTENPLDKGAACFSIIKSE